MIFYFSQPFIFQICGYAEAAGKRTGKGYICGTHHWFIRWTAGGEYFWAVKNGEWDLENGMVSEERLKKEKPCVSVR